MKTRFTLKFMWGILTLLALACTIGTAPRVINEPTPTPTPLPPQMPDLPDYIKVDTENIQGYIAKLASGTSLLAEQPELAAVIMEADKITACYQKKGAVDIRVYVNKTYPLSSGAIMIADRNKLTDFGNLIECATYGGAPEFRPCFFAYELPRNNNVFYIAFVGSTDQICSDFCKNLDGCEDYSEPDLGAPRSP